MGYNSSGRPSGQEGVRASRIYELILTARIDTPHLLPAETMEGGEQAEKPSTQYAIRERCSIYGWF